MRFKSSVEPVWREPAFWCENGYKTDEELMSEFGGGKDSYWSWRKKMIHIERGVCLFDIHYPSCDMDMINRVLAFVERFKPDYLILGGDNLDMAPVSHWLHDKGRRGELEGKRLKEDYDGFQHEILDALVLPDLCRKIWLYGNHEGWMDEYIDKHPEAEGFLEIERNMDLSDWETYEYGQSAVVADSSFTHGSFTNLHCAYKTVQTWGRNIYFGHGHTEQLHTLPTPTGEKPIVGHEMPCLCDLNPDYMHNVPSSWQNGFGAFYVSDGILDMHTIHIYNGCFVAPDGTRY